MSDIFAGQPSDADLLAELYDLEHDEVVEDLVFYREMVARGPDRSSISVAARVACSARSWPAARRRILGIDGSAALLRAREPPG